MTLAFELDKVSKVYKVYSTPSDRLREALSFRGKKFHKEVSALSDITLSVPKGEVLGIVGHNGAGKSTLLKIVAGLIPPSGGAVKRHGETSTLLDLGAGMNLEHSGRENAEFLSRLDTSNTNQSAERTQAIVEFADIGDMIERPMKYYSTGMRARVAFAAATSIRPDLLIVDEVLAVGDSQFQRKCYARMEALMSEGSTVLFVSHDNQTIVEFCKRAILLDHGKLLADGAPTAVVKDYLRNLDSKNPAIPTTDQSKQQVKQPSKQQIDPDLEIASFSQVRNAEIELHSITMNTLSNERLNTLSPGDTVVLRIEYDCKTPYTKVVFPISIRTKKGVEIAGVRHPIDHGTIDLPSGRSTVVFEFRCPLLQGDYFVSAGVTQIEGETKTVLFRGDDCFVFKVLPNPDRVHWGFIDIDATSRVVFEHES